MTQEEFRNIYYPELSLEEILYLSNLVQETFNRIASITYAKKSGCCNSIANAWKRFIDLNSTLSTKGKDRSFWAGINEFEKFRYEYLIQKDNYKGGRDEL